MLRVTLLGNLGAEPEVRFTQKGTQIAQFRVAVNQVRTGPDGERQESTEWFRIRVANRQIEFVQRLSKGTKVLVMGRLDIGHYQSKDGDTRTSFDVWADDVQAMSSRAFDADGMLEPDPDAPEPAVAGVSSVSPGNATRATANGHNPARSGRSNPRAEAPNPNGPGGDLEDLPF